MKWNNITTVERRKEKERKKNEFQTEKNILLANDSVGVYGIEGCISLNWFI